MVWRHLRWPFGWCRRRLGQWIWSSFLSGRSRTEPFWTASHDSKIPIWSKNIRLFQHFVGKPTKFYLVTAAPDLINLFVGEKGRTSAQIGKKQFFFQLNQLRTFDLNVGEKQKNFLFGRLSKDCWTVWHGRIESGKYCTRTLSQLATWSGQGVAQELWAGPQRITFNWVHSSSKLLTGFHYISYWTVMFNFRQSVLLSNISLLQDLHGVRNRKYPWFSLKLLSNWNCH